MDIAGTLLKENRPVLFKMHGYSMYPVFKEGDLGQVEKCAAKDLKIGDIVVFKANHKLIAHRLMKIQTTDSGMVFVAQGDKNLHLDAPFTEEALIGKITSFQRKNRVKSPKSVSAKLISFFSLRFRRLIIPVYNTNLWFKIQLIRLLVGFKSLKSNLSIIGKDSEKSFWINAIISVLQGVVPFALIVCIKKLIDYLTFTGVPSDTGQEVFIYLLLLTALVFMSNAVLTVVRGYYFEKLSQSVTHRIYGLLHKKHAALDLSYYENPEQQDKIHRAVQEAGFRPVKILNELLNGIKTIASVAIMLILFISIKWYLVVLLLIAILPGVLVKLRFSRKLYQLKDAHSTKEREMNYFNRILTGFPFAKELKLFGFSGFFLKRFTKVQRELFAEKLSLSKSELLSGIMAQLFAVLLIFISIGYVSWLKINGEISIGTVVLFFFVFQRGYSVLNEFIYSLTRLMEDNVFLNDFMDFLNLPEKSAVITEKQSFAPLKKGITIENVSFRYETSKRDALKSVNITIPAGKTVAFVGANGSGKTTMIKLLCGFYKPVSGRILLDEVDVSQIGEEAIREQITAVFQDFALYNIPAMENIGLGNIQTNFDSEKVKEAAQAAGVADVLERLPNGYNTLLGNLFKNGEELSIGQWQKIAVARAFYRDSPILLMDEPSSALDVDAELQILHSLKKLSKDKTVVMISHRLSTIQWADLIYVFDRGEIKESGTPQELMDLKGTYFNMVQSANEKVV